MKIALFHNLPSGGARRGMVEMVKGLVARGHVVDEICPETADLSFLPLDGVVRRQVVLPFGPMGVCPRRVPLLTPYITAARLIVDLAALARVNRRAAQAIDSGGYDVVFSHDCQLAQNPALLRFLRVPSLHYCHHGARVHIAVPEAPGGSANGLWQRAKRAYYAAPRALYPWQLRREAGRNITAATVVATNSRFSAEALYRAYGIQSRICYYGVDSAVFRPLGLAREPFVLSVGALHYYKGYRFLVAALGHISAERRPRLVIAANSAEPEEQRIIEKVAARCAVQVTITRIMDDEELTRLYNQAAAFVYTPIMEPWGLTPVEAMACGTPVVAVAEGGVRESVTHGETGWLTERDESEFAEAVSLVMGDPALGLRLGTAGVARTRAVFAWERTVDRVEGLLSKVTG